LGLLVAFASDRSAATGRCNPLDRSDSGESGWREAARSCNASSKRTDWRRIAFAFKLSTDPKFAANLKDVVGVYFDPPRPCGRSVGR
jgi:hypothetical protein